MEINYKKKYLKYKNKYLELKKKIGGNKTSIKLSEELGSKRGEHRDGFDRNYALLGPIAVPVVASIAAYNVSKLGTLGTLTAARYVKDSIKRSFKCVKDNETQKKTKTKIKEKFKYLLGFPGLRNVLLEQITEKENTRYSNWYEEIKQKSLNIVINTFTITRLKKNISTAIQAYKQIKDHHNNKDLTNWDNTSLLEHIKKKINLDYHFSHIHFNLEDYYITRNYNKEDHLSFIFNQININIDKYQKRFNKIKNTFPDEIEEIIKDYNNYDININKYEALIKKGDTNNIFYDKIEKHIKLINKNKILQEEYMNAFKNVDDKNKIKDKMNILIKNVILDQYVDDHKKTFYNKIINVLEELLEELDCYCKNIIECLPDNFEQISPPLDNSLPMSPQLNNFQQESQLNNSQPETQSNNPRPMSSQSNNSKPISPQSNN